MSGEAQSSRDVSGLTRKRAGEGEAADFSAGVGRLCRQAPILADERRRKAQWRRGTMIA
jgi:hypothetical protein